MKRTLALILALVMVLPVSFISALAHGPGVGKNDYINQSIHNAMNQPLPEVVTVDGKYDDTAWDKDEWNTVNKRTGTWDSNAPDDVNFSYKYQIKMDGDYLYGVFALASGASEITVWLNSENATAATDTIVISNLTAAMPVIKINGNVPSSANGTDSSVLAEQYQIKAADDTVEKGMRVVEFRVYRKAFASGESVSYFVAAKKGENKLYYPVIATNGEVAPKHPGESWPANAIVVTRRDLLDVNSSKHLPVNDSNYPVVMQNVESQYEMTIDGRLTESAWMYMSDIREQDKTNHQYFEPGSREDKKEALLDLTLGGNHAGTGYSDVHGNVEAEHSHTGSTNYKCGLAHGTAEYSGQIRFKYDLRTDGKNLYGGVAVYDEAGLAYHNIPLENALTADLTREEVQAAYPNMTFLNVHIYGSGGNELRILHLAHNSQTGKTTVQVVDTNWNLIAEYGHGKAGETGTCAGGSRKNDQLVTFEFKLNSEDIYGDDVTALQEGLQVMIEAYDAPATNAIGGGQWNERKYDAYARTYAEKVNINSHPAPNTYVSGQYMNGSIENNEWNNLNAADRFVNSAFYTGYEDDSYAGQVDSYIYDVVADHDYIYGASLILLNTAVTKNNDSSKATAFRLWLNKFGEQSAYTGSVAFYLGANGDTRVKFDKYGNTTYVMGSDGKYFVNESTNDKEYGLQAKMRVVNINEMVEGYEALYPEMAAAIKAGKVAVVEYRIPFTMVGCEMPLYNGGSNRAAFSYYTSVEQGIDSHLGIFHPMPNTFRDGSNDHYKVFDPNRLETWSTGAAEAVYSNEVFDIIKLDGMRTEFFWSSYKDYIGVNGSTGYYDEIQTTNNTFAYGQTIYVGRNNIYGYVILDDEAVPGESEYVLWINAKPGTADGGYTHAYYFTATEDGIEVVGKKADGSDITSSDYVIAKAAGSTINGRTNIEFIIDIRAFDADRSGFEYATSFRHEVNEEVLNLCYPAPDAYDKLFVTHINQSSSLDSREGNVFSYDHIQRKLSGDSVTGPNGWAQYYVIFEYVGDVDNNTKEYKVKAVQANTGSAGWVTDFMNQVPQNGFLYGIYDTGAIINSNVETTTDKTVFGAGYIEDIKAQFTVGAVVRIKGLDLTKTVDPGNYLVGGGSKLTTYAFELEAQEVYFSVAMTDADNRNANFPENGVWYNTALSVDTLDYYYPEMITIDGTLGDSGWDPNGWTEVAENVNGVLQSTNYAQNFAWGFNYKYQMRTDGENVYFAFVVHDRNFADLIENTNDEGQTVTSLPSVRVWIKSNASKYSDAVSFTHLYDIRYGLNAELQGIYKDGANYKETTLEITAEDLTIHGQEHASFGSWYSKQNQGLFLPGEFSGEMTRGDAIRNHTAVLNGTQITYTTTSLRFAEHIGTGGNGYAYPWGGNANPSGATCTNQGYGDSLIFGETIEIMDNRTTGAHGSDETWYAYTDTSAFEVGNEHGRWTYNEQEDESYVEFRFNLSELGFTKEELEDPSFEYFVHGASSGDNYTSPYTLFNPAMTHIPYAGERSSSIYQLPFWNFDEVTSLKYNASTEYSHMLRNNYRPAVSLGAKINDNFDGNGSYAIRFGGVYTEEYIRRLAWGATNKDDDDYVRDGVSLPYDNADQKGLKGDAALSSSDRILGGANMDGITNYWDVSKVGIVFRPTHLLGKKTVDGEEQLDLFLDTKGAISADSVGIENWKTNSNFADYEKYVFYVTFNGIPQTESALNTKFSFRSFITYYDWQGKYDGSPAVYDEILERSWNDVKNAGEDPFAPETPGADVGGGGEEEEESNNHNGETIAYIPLDNRPVNIDRAIYLAQSTGFNILMPPEEYYTTNINYLKDEDSATDPSKTSDESSVGNPEKLFEWLQANKNNADYFVISLDQLLSGGLVGSRDYAGINSLPNAATDGAYYDPKLAFEKTVIEYLAGLVKEKEVVFFDSQMRLASTSNFNGYPQAYYNFLREGGYALQGRPDGTVDVTADNALEQIFNNYELNVNGQYILNGGSIYQTDSNGEYVLDANGQKQLAVNKNTTYTLKGYTITAEYIDRYLKSRERKMKLSEMLFNYGVVQNSKLFYVGIDDSNDKDSIQTVETEWLNYKGAGIKNFKVFAGIDEIGLMSFAAFVTSCYNTGKFSSVIGYYGDGKNEIADDYGNETLDQSIRVHLEAVGAKVLSTTNTKNYLSVLVLTKGATTADINDLIDTARENIRDGIPTCIIDASETQGQLGVALVNSDLEISKLLGYSNWNTVANAAGLSISPAAARYVYLKNSDVITEASHVGALKQISYSFIKDVAYTYKFKTQWTDYAGKNTYKDTGDRESNRKLCAIDAVSNDSFDTWKNKIVEKINGGDGQGDSMASVMTAVGEYSQVGQIKFIGELYWPWNRMFEASFDLAVRGATNWALYDNGGRVTLPEVRDDAGTLTYTASLNDGVNAGGAFTWDNQWWSTIYYEKVDGATQVTFDFTDGNGNATAHRVGYLAANILRQTGSGIVLPEAIKVYALNENGEYVYVGEFSYNDSITNSSAWITAGIDSVETTSIRVDIYGYGHVIMNEIQIW